MSIKLKVCGMRQSANIAELLNVSPDYVGFIFYQKSARYVGDQFTVNDMPTFPSSIKKIGVFVNEAPEKIMEMAKKFNLQGVQLHGNEDPDVCRKIKEVGFITIKAFAIDENIDFSITNPYESVVDYFLFDTKTSNYGGSGRTFDWNLLKRYKNEKPFFLSGGVDLVNLEELERLAGLNIHAIDINSRFETKPGLKDVSKIRTFKEKLASLNTF